MHRVAASIWLARRMARTMRRAINTVGPKAIEPAIGETTTAAATATLTTTAVGARYTRGENNRNDHGSQAYRGRNVSPPRAYAYARPAYPSYAHRWQRGERLGHYNDRYRVIDYRDYRLDRPPYGYRWVEDDNGDFILAALAGGLIAAIIANSY